MWCKTLVQDCGGSRKNKDDGCEPSTPTWLGRTPHGPGTLLVLLSRGKPSGNNHGFTGYDLACAACAPAVRWATQSLT